MKNVYYQILNFFLTMHLELRISLTITLIMVKRTEKSVSKAA